MTYDFFAAEEDKIKLLSYIFTETDLRIFDLSSAYGEDIKEYKTVEDISAQFDLRNETSGSICFQLWSPIFQGKPVYKRIELDPKRCKGHTFRFSTEGWGLIQLYLGGIKDAYLKHSHIGHFNEKGALRWEPFNKTNGRVNAWDWQAIQKTSSHLKYLLHKKLSVKTIGSYGVLPGAEKLEKGGFILR